MEYFKSGLKSVLGAPQPGTQPSGAETVERLIDRVQSSTLLEDRRDACRALKALSRTYRVEVGAQGMDTMRHVLETDRNDSEIVGYALDTLCNITSTEVFEEEDRTHLGQEALSTVGGQFTEIFIKQPDNVSLVLGLMEEFDFHIRWPAVKLLTNMLTSRPKEIQDNILVSPMGVSKLMDLLSDSREVIRNDALLMLILLTKNNANIQKIVAFENAFDRLFDVIVEEGGADGGIVVEDCLLLMLNLLRNNTSNQNFFKEGSYIQKFAPMFALPADGSEDGWSAQKVSNSHCMLQVVRTLVSPGNPAQVTSSCQSIMKICGLLRALCDILMASGIPADVLTESIITVAEVIRGNQQNQEVFSGVMAPSNPPRPAIVVLLMSMVNEKQPFILRCAVLYCFQCFLFKNESGQSQIAQTLLPSSSEHMSNLTTGQLLCGGLFSPDPLSNWFSAVALSHSLLDNPAQKEQLLRVLLTTTAGQPPVSLLQQCTLLLQQVPKVQSRLGLLMLLCSWLAHCPQAVQQFLTIPSSIPFLTAQVSTSEHGDHEELVQGICAFLMGICVHFNDDSVISFTKEKLCQLIAKRIGLETFLDHLGKVSRHEMYSRAAKHPQLKARQASELILDHEFCRLFKALEGLVVKAVTPKPKEDIVNGGSDLSDSALVMQYKELIRDQDRRMQEMSERLAALELEKTSAVSQAEELTTLVQQLKDHNLLLRAQQLSETPTQPIQQSCQRTDAVLLNMDDVESGVVLKTNNNNNTSHMTTLLSQAEERARLAEDRALQAESRALHAEKLVRDAENRALHAEQQVRDADMRVIAAEQQIATLQAEVAKVQHDQEDLLELLTDQDARLNQYKSRLKNLGEKVEDEEEEEGDEEELVALTSEVHSAE